MLLFITCIKHPDTVKDNSQLSKLLQGTINSLANQTNENYKLLVVCNRGATFDINSLSIDIEFLHVDFLAPKKMEVVDQKSRRERHNQVRKDKGIKYYSGLQHAEKDAPEYVMFIDADDYLHKDLVSYVLNEANTSGFIIDKGYSYKMSSNIMAKFSPFYKTCGTCNIYKFDLLKTYISTPHSISEDDILSNIDNEFLFYNLGSHLNGTKFFEHTKSPYSFIPFHAAAYVIDSGENDSGIKQMLGLPVFTNDGFLTDFGVPKESIQVKYSLISLYYYRLMYMSKKLLKKLLKLN